MPSQPELKLSVPEVLASVRSLYADELKSFGRLLLKRLRERAASVVAISRGLPSDAVEPESMPKIDPKRLRQICQSCPQLCVHAEDGREFSVTLAGRSCCFLDACSPTDPYPQQMWDDAAAYFSSLDCEEMCLPGGRYASAQVLLRRRLPFLAARSLGQVCHIVQLAVSQKRLLGYREGQLVPRAFSEEWVKEQCAIQQMPSRDRADSLPVATWEQARQCMQQLLCSEPNPEIGTLTLSNVKRLFRSRFELELSETALGYPRLFDLLHDVRFRDVCAVQAHRNGQLLVKRAEGPRQVPCHQLATPIVLPQAPGTGGLLSTASQTTAPGVWNAVFMGSVTYPLAPAQMNSMPPSLAALRKVNVDLGMDACWNGSQTWDPSLDSPCIGSKGCDDDSDQSTDFPCSQDLSGCSSEDGERLCRSSLLALQAEAIRAEEEESATAPSVSNCDFLLPNELDHVVKNTFIDIPSPTTIGAKRRLRSVPKDMGVRSTMETAQFPDLIS